MLYTLFTFVTIKRRRFRAVAEVGDSGLPRQTLRDHICGNTLLRRAIDFHAVAGGKDQGFRAACCAKRGISASAAGEALPRFHVRSVMT
jgi:hypothetical protein